MGTQSDIRDQRYRNVRYQTEERRVRHYIGYWNKLLCDIRYPTSTFVYPGSAVVVCQVRLEGPEFETRAEMISQFNLQGSLGNNPSILDIGISDIDLVRYRNGS